MTQQFTPGHSRCKECIAAKKNFEHAQKIHPDALTLTAVCSDQHGQSNEVPGTAVMEIKAVLPDGEEGRVESVISGVIVYCAHAFSQP